MIDILLKLCKGKITVWIISFLAMIVLVLVALKIIPANGPVEEIAEEVLQSETGIKVEMPGS